jgi:Fe-S cluster assembly iron-binding protein IscA
MPIKGTKKEKRQYERKHALFGRSVDGPLRPVSVVVARGREDLMLQVTDAAVSVFKEIVQREDVSGGAIRLAQVTGPTGESEIAIQTVEGPREGDAPTEARGLDVFVAEDLAQPLDAAVLDAEATEAGNKLVLHPQTAE